MKHCPGWSVLGAVHPAAGPASPSVGEEQTEHPGFVLATLLAAAAVLRWKPWVTWDNLWTSFRGSQVNLCPRAVPRELNLCPRVGGGVKSKINTNDPPTSGMIREDVL